MVNSTIAAIATPTGKGGIGIIRISGPDALKLSLQNFTFYNKKININNIDSHRVYYGHINDNDCNIVDEVLYIYMKSPKTYTTEDVVEIQSHSSPIVLRIILDILVKNGIRIADPGEFTKRAFLNGRIDLTQAEAVIDIINAKSKSSLDIALSQIKGNLALEIKIIKNNLIKLKSYIEAIIDFPDEISENDEFYSICNNVNSDILQPLVKLKKNFDEFSFYKEGIKIVIAGPPNSGKSSLMNILLNKDKSIVTNIPGTTRDLIEDLISLDGIPCMLTDTAGLRETDDLVEQIGISKAYEQLDLANLIVFISDASRILSDEEILIFKSLYEKYSKKPILFLNNKIDLGNLNNTDFFTQKIESFDISVKKNIGIIELKEKIISLLLKNLPDSDFSLVPNIRHNNIIIEIIKRVSSIIENINNDFSFELISIDLNESLELIDEILGVNCKIDILDQIFSNFCIGK